MEMTPTSNETYKKTQSIGESDGLVNGPAHFKQENDTAQDKIADTEVKIDLENQGLPSSRWHRFKQWYVGERGSNGKRYCGHRMSRGPFICLHVVGIFLLLCVIIIPIVTAVVIPNMIQSKFDQSIRTNPFNKAKNPTAASELPSSFEVMPDGSGADFRFNLTLAPLMSIGGIAELVGPTVFIISDPDLKDWASITIPDSISFDVSKKASLSMLGNFSVYDKPGQVYIDSIFPKKIIPLVVATKWTIRFWGFTWYRKLQLQSRYDMPIPTTLQEKFDEVVQNPFSSTSNASNASNASRTTFEYFSTGSPSNFRINTTIANLTVLPGIVEVVGPTTFAIYDVKNKGWANVTFNTVSFPVHRTTRLSIYGNFSIYSLPTPSVITNILTSNEFVMVVKTWWTIKFEGVVWYTKLELQSRFDLNSDTGTQLWSSIKCKLYTC